jgi:predicted RNase H-like HicB family nuclease
MKVTALIQEVDGWFTATAAEIPGVNTQARTMEELRENFREALEMVLAANKELAERDLQGAARHESITI